MLLKRLEGLHAYGDGIVTLLKNYAVVVPSAHTRLLLLEPASGALTALPQTGLLGRRKADPILLKAAAADTHTGYSAAGARAQRIGWRAATLRGDLSNTERLMEIISTLDAIAESDQW